MLRSAFILAMAIALTWSLGRAKPPQDSGSFASAFHKQIYPDPAAATGDIQHALAEARREHKRVLLDFGGNWCSDCLVLDYYFHQPPNAELLSRYFILVDINVGQLDENTEIAERYGVPIKKGVPELAVLDPHGRLLFSQKGGFDAMVEKDPSAVTAFLNRWKPSR